MLLRWPLADQLRQAWDVVQTTDAVVQIIPKLYAQLATSLLDGGESVPSTTACCAAGAAADFALLHVVANIRLAAVVRQRHNRLLYHPQQVGLVFTPLPYHPLHAPKTLPL